MSRTFKPVPSLLALALLVPGALVVMNLADPPRAPAVAKILDAPAAPAAPAGDAARRAYALLRERPPGHPEFTHCGGDLPHPCWIDDLTPEVQTVLKDNEALLDWYQRVMACADFRAFGEPDGDRVFDPVSTPEPSLHRLFTLKLASWVRGRGEVRAWHLLESSTLFYSAVLRHGDTLLARMMALVALETNVRVIEAELRRRPSWTPPPELIGAFDLPDPNDLLAGAVAAETRVVAQMVRAMSRGWRRLLLRPNETVNQFYDLSTQIAFTDCHGDDVTCVPALADLRGKRLHLVNQLGQSFLPTVLIDVRTRDKLVGRLRNLAEAKANLRARP